MPRIAVLEEFLKRFLRQFGFDRGGHHQRRDVSARLLNAERQFVSDFGLIDQPFKLGGVGCDAEHIGNFLQLLHVLPWQASTLFYAAYGRGPFVQQSGESPQAKPCLQAECSQVEAKLWHHTARPEENRTIRHHTDLLEIENRPLQKDAACRKPDSQQASSKRYMHRIDNTTNLGGATVGKRISNRDFQNGAQPLGGEVFYKDVAGPESDVNGDNILSRGSRTEGERYPGLLKTLIRACYPWAIFLTTVAGST